LGSVPGLKTVFPRTARTKQGLISAAAFLQNTVDLRLFHSFRDHPSYSHVATFVTKK
jgi:pyruvate/2-oxoglutarate/acetoin dehydrogenase E1 component